MDNLTDKAIRVFSDYLETKEQRKTKERFCIVKEVYSKPHHFDAEQLYKWLKKKRSGISRATVYNTLDLLVECNLVKKHKFGNLQAHYERSYGFRQHDHLICSDCNHVFEFCDPRLQQIQAMAGEMLNFKITDHSLSLYGKCNEFAEKGGCRYRGK